MKDQDIIGSEYDNPTFKQFLEAKPKQELVKLLMSNYDIKIPISVFCTNIAPLESLVKYLKEHNKMTFNVIAERLNRSNKTIWATYNKVSKTKVKVSSSSYSIPLLLLSKDKCSIMESLVYHLHTHDKLTLHQMAVILHRDDRTIWTTLDRAKKKNEHKR